MTSEKPRAKARPLFGQGQIPYHPELVAEAALASLVNVSVPTEAQGWGGPICVPAVCQVLSTLESGQSFHAHVNPVAPWTAPSPTSQVGTVRGSTLPTVTEPARGGAGAP